MHVTEITNLYLHCHHAFYAFVVAKVGRDAADDVLQDTFEAISQQREEAPHEPAQWRPWAFGILRNKTLHEVQRRQRKRHDNLFLADAGADEQPTLSADIAEAVAEKLTSQAVWLSLSHKDQALLLAVATHADLPGAEIAAKLGVTHTVYRRRLSRLRTRLLRASAT